MTSEASLVKLTAQEWVDQMSDEDIRRVRDYGASGWVEGIGLHVADVRPSDVAAEIDRILSR
jgi:hypothetical protein